MRANACGVHDARGLGGQPQVERDDVRGLEQDVQRHQRDAAARGLAGPAGQALDRHAEGAREPRDPRADLADAEQPERPPGEAVEVELGHAVDVAVRPLPRLGREPAAVRDGIVLPAQLPAQRQHQHQAMLGDGVRGRVADGGHPDPGPLGRREIDELVAGAQELDQREPGRPGEQGLVEARPRQPHEARRPTPARRRSRGCDAARMSSEHAGGRSSSARLRTERGRLGVSRMRIDDPRRAHSLRPCARPRERRRADRERAPARCS